MFKDTGRGFHMTFENGYVLSVQWNPGTYCSDRNYDDNAESKTAEVAIWRKEDETFIRLRDWDDDVQGWYSADQVAELINKVKNWS